MKQSKITIIRFFTILSLIFFIGAGSNLKACDTSPVITLSNVTDIGGGFFTIDIQMCIGDGGSASGFTTSFGGGLNITAFTPPTLVDNNTATGSLSGGVLDYNYAGGTAPGNMFVIGFAATCFNYTVTVDGDPAGQTATFVGINSTHPGSCAFLGGNTGTSNVPAPPPACGDNFFDPGGVGSNYGNNDLETYTVCPNVPGDDVTINFSAFNLESGWDYLYIWDGNSASGSADFSLTGTTIPSSITATNPSGCLTIRFDSDGSITRPGFEASISCLTILPVKLTSFTGEHLNSNKSNLLAWTTATEINNDYFILERGINSTGKINWERIEYISGAGNSNSILNYEFTDFSPKFNTVNYYRLKQVDFDGAFEYSQTISINNDSQIDYEISDLYPNPTSRQFSFVLSTQPNSEAISLQIYNSLGRLVKSEKIVDTQNQLNFDINVDDLNDGVYFVHLNIAESKQVKKLTIVR